MAKLKKLMLLCAAFTLTASMGIVTACGGGDNSSSSSAGSSDSASVSDSASTDDSSNSSSEDPQPVEPVNAFEEVSGLTFDDMTSIEATNAGGTPTPITLNFPSAGKYVLFTDTKNAQVGENTTWGNYGTTYQIEVDEAGEATYAVFYYDLDTTTESTTVNYYLYKLVDVALDMNGGAVNALGFDVNTLFTITPPTAGRYMISFSSEVSIDGVLKTTHIVETMEDAERIEFLVNSEAIANMAYYTVEYTITEAPAVSVTAGNNEATIMAGCDNLFSFTTETAGEYKLVCDSEDVIFGVYDDLNGWIDYYSTYTYYEDGAAKNAGLFFTAEAGVPLKFYAMVSADPAVDTSVTFTISPLTAEEKYPTEITVNADDYAQATIPANGSVDVKFDGVEAGVTYIINWKTSDNVALKLGNVEFTNGSVYFAYAEDMTASFINKADTDASVSEAQCVVGQYGGQVSDTFDVYMNGDTSSSPTLVFNVTPEMAPSTYQLTWNSTVYTVGTMANNTTDGATGLTFENISGRNPIMTAVAPSDVEGKITFTAEEKVEPPTTISVGSNTVTIGANGTTNVQLSTAAAGKYFIMEVTDGDFLAPNMMGSMAPVQFPFVFKTYDNGDGTFTSQMYQVGSMNNEVTFVIYEATDLAEGTNEVAVPAGETVYACYSNIADSSIWTSTVALASGETTAKVEVYVLNNSTYTYEWVEVTDSLEFATDYFVNVLFRITSSATDADTADFTITPVVSE